MFRRSSWALLAFALLFLSRLSSAQNLVHSGSFESPPVSGSFAARDAGENAGGRIADGAGGAPAGPPAKPLLPNGDFEAATRSPDWPDAWPHPDGATWEVEKDNHFLRLRPAKPGQMLTVYRTIDIKPEYKAFEFRFRTRYADLKRGKENWHDGRIILDFKDKEGKKLKGSPPPPAFKGTSDGWKERTVRFLVPEGAVTLEVMPALLKVAGGTLDLDDLALTPITDGPTVAALRKGAVPSPPVEIRGQLPPPPELRVVGNRLKTADGKPAWLQGVNVPSLEWSNAGENVLRSIVVAIEDWKANAIRLPIRDDRWFGRDPGQKDGGALYRKLIDQAVEAASTRGAYLILDLHRYRAPTEGHAAFWKDAAAHFKNNPAVLFDLFNEPHDISWEVWRNGGGVEDKRNKGGVAAENNEPVERFTSVGMQRLVDVVREAGAKNVVIVGGLDWAYDLSGVLRGYALTDRGGNGIVYATHVYNWKTGWQKKFLEVAQKHPILVGECGGEIEKLAFVPADRQEDPTTWAPDLLGLIQKHRLNWTAWSFHPKASPKLLTGWDYKPTPYWGELVRAALRGKAFELTRLR